MFKFKFIREDERYRRDLMVIAELGQISIEDPNLTDSDISQVTLQTVKDLTDRMTSHVDFLTGELLKSKMLNIVLGGNLAILYYVILRK